MHLSSADSTTVTVSLQDSQKKIHLTAAADPECCCSSPNKDKKVDHITQVLASYH